MTKCRAFLSPVFKNSGWIEPADENDEFEIYRCNLGVVSLNLPMIYQKAKNNGTEFFDEIDYYMSLGRSIGKNTANYLYKFKASSDPLCFMEGGFNGGTLGPDDSIEPVLKRSTISFGYGGLHEISVLHNGKGLSEDQTFAIETMKHINNNIEKFKKEDHLIWAIYGRKGCRSKTIKPANGCPKKLGLTGKTKSIKRYVNPVPRFINLACRDHRKGILIGE